MGSDRALQYDAEVIMGTAQPLRRRALNGALDRAMAGAADPRAIAHGLDYRARLVTAVRLLSEQRGAKAPWSCP